LSGTGTAHAYTDNERNYLFQLGPDMLQVPGSDGDKLQNGYWSATTCGATAWLCPDQNGKSDQAFWIGRVSDSPCLPCQG
jgi:hypothetical protein